jgi:hypothetical protein
MGASRCFRNGNCVLAATAMATTAAVSGERMFTARIMAGVAYVALSVTRFVSVEVVEPLFAAPRQGAMVTIMGVEAIIHVAVKAVRTVEPGASAKKHASNEPIRSVVAIGGAVIRRVVEVPIGAGGLHSNADCNLSG